jgi:hypothetical protein
MTGGRIIEQVPITQIWALLGGGPIRHGRAQAFYRKGGDGFNVSINDKIGAWHDFVTGDGGGKLALICHVRAGSRAEALGWLASMLGVPLDSTALSRKDRRRYAQARQHAPELGRLATLWHAERLAELDELKRDALERDDMLALMAAAQEHHLLSILAPDGVIRAFFDAKRKWPEHTTALIADGERWAELSELAVAALIAQWHDDAVDIERWETDGGASA